MMAAAPLLGVTLIPGCNTPGPQAGEMTVPTIPGRATPIQLVGFNTDQSPVTFRLSSPRVAHGTLTGTAPNLIYRSTTGFLGTDRFGFTVTAANGRTTSAVVTVEVKRPNIVLVMSDDQTAEQQRFLSRTNVYLGMEGTTFDNMVVSYSECCPSRATLLSGQYAHNHGVLSSSLNTGGVTKFRDGDTLATRLQAAGYHTSLAGKYLNGYGVDVPTTYVPPGWSDWFGLTDPNGYNYFDYTVSDNGRPVSYGSDPGDYSTDVVFGRAERTISTVGGTGRPFFVMVTPTAPHNMAQNVSSRPAPRHEGLFPTEKAPRTPAVNLTDVSSLPPWIRDAPPITNLAGIDNVYRQAARSLQAVDEGVERLHSALKAKGELDNTVFLFTSDNGYHYGDHRVTLGKSDQYEETLRVPLIVRGPGFPAGRRVNQPVANVDLAPTLVGVAGIGLGREPDGFDLRPFITDRTRGVNRPVLIENGPLWGRRTWVGVRDPRWTYVESSTGDRELYDRLNDPYETRNLYGNPANNADTRLAQYYGSVQTNRLKACSGANCRALS
jgi:N-acetylglucosamine-6-sulfatase